MADLQHAVPGQPFVPRASDWNAFVDAARVVRDARVIFGVPRLDGGGGGGLELLPYIITETDDGDNMAVRRELFRTIKAKRAEQITPFWSAMRGADEENLDVSLMRGVSFTNQCVLAASVMGRVRIIAGFGGEIFRGAAIDDIDADSGGLVGLAYLDVSNRLQWANVHAINTLDRGVVAGTTLPLIVFSDATQDFQIIVGGCPAT